VGKEFDYAVHNAVMTSPSDEYEEGVVIQELQKGYALGDEVIRAAYVVVAC
jgi:molecular chaperone GrpE